MGLSLLRLKNREAAASFGLLLANYDVLIDPILT